MANDFLTLADRVYCEMEEEKRERSAVQVETLADPALLNAKVDAAIESTIEAIQTQAGK